MEARVALAIGVLENGQMIGVQKDHSPNSWRASSRIRFAYFSAFFIDDFGKLLDR